MKKNKSSSIHSSILMRPSLTLNALSNLATLAVAVLVGFLLTPFVIKHLGKTGYGIWTLIISIIGYYGILDLGVSSAITRYVARYTAKKDNGALNETINTSLAIFFFLGFFIVIASFLLADPLSFFFKIPIDKNLEFKQTVWLLGIATGLGFPGRIFGAVIRANERFIASNIIIIFVNVVRALIIVLLLSKGFGLIGVGFAYLISTLLLIFFNYILFRMLFNHIKIQLSSVSLTMVRLILGFGAATTVAFIADIMRFNLDSFVIGKWIDLNSVAVYAISALIVRYFLQIIAQSTQVIFTPRFAAIDGQGNRDQLQRLFIKSLSVASFLSFGLGSLIIILGTRFIVLWVGADFLEAAPVLAILTFSYSIALSQATGIALMYALKKHYLFAGASIIEGIANIGLSIYLAPRYGIVGVAVGTAVPMLVIKLFVQPVYVSRIVGIPLLRYFRQLAPAFGLAIIVVFIGKNLPNIISFENGYISLVFSALPYLMAFILLYVLDRMFVKRKRSQEI